MTIAEQIADTKRQLNDPGTSACRRRDLTKYLERLYRAQRREIWAAKATPGTREKGENKPIDARNAKG